MRPEDSGRQMGEVKIKTLITERVDRVIFLPLAIFSRGQALLKLGDGAAEREG